jgi:hypothetical protein
VGEPLDGVRVNGRIGFEGPHVVHTDNVVKKLLCAFQ